MKLSYRSEIDGLRFLAVIPVVLYHAGFNLFSGGYVGVDIFFVISGYLITTIILKQLSDKSFSIKKFYERRARRILPALIFVLLITSILAFIFLTRTELKNYFESLNATLFFYSNFYFWKNSPYFQLFSDTQPLLHTWSLSIEEQFYIFFPIILILFFKFFKKYILIFFVIGFFFSLIICQILALKTGGNLNFYFTLSRGWELFLGAICAYLLEYKKILFSRKLNNIISIIGITLIFFSIFLYSKKILYPSFYSLLPTIGTALIIIYADKDSFVKKFLSLKIFVSIGLLSYSFYLWHQPLLVFGRIYFYNNFSIEKKVFLLILSLLLSIFSYFFIEKKFRQKNNISSNLFFKILLKSIIVLFIFSILSISFFTKNSTEKFLAKLLLRVEAVYPTRMNERVFTKERILYENSEPKIIIIGSSRFMQTSKDMFKDEFLNLSVSGASMEDHIAITGMAIEKFQFNKLLLGVDPWLFNTFSNQERWKYFLKEYFLVKKNILKSNNENTILSMQKLDLTYKFYEKIIDKIYTFLNFRDIVIKKSNFEDLKKNKISAILKNGSRVGGYGTEIERNSHLEAKYSMDPYKFSEENYEIYKNFLNYLINIHKKEITLVLIPYHPTSYKLTIEAMPYYKNLEEKIRELGQINNVKILGSFDPSLTNCNENEFYDFMHTKNSCLKKIIKSKN